MSLPRHLLRWDVSRAATLKVLVYLWEFCDRDDDDAWCFHLDEQIIEGCGLSNERQLRRCLKDLSQAGLVHRERGAGHEHGFRLSNRQPRDFLRSKVTASVRSDRSEVTGKTVRSDRPTLLENRKSRELTTVDEPVSEFTLIPSSPAKKRTSRKKTKPTRADIELVFAALCSSRDRLSQRLFGKPATKIKLISREDDIRNAIMRHGVESLAESLGNRGDFGGETALSILTNAATPFRSAQVKLGLDRDELKRLAEHDGGGEPRVTRSEMNVIL